MVKRQRIYKEEKKKKWKKKHLKQLHKQRNFFLLFFYLFIFFFLPPTTLSRERELEAQDTSAIRATNLSFSYDRVRRVRLHKIQKVAVVVRDRVTNVSSIILKVSYIPRNLAILCLQFRFANYYSAEYVKGREINKQREE